MPKAIYEEIYRILKKKIERNEYTSESFLPSENDLVSQFQCSRNTIRRAISMLANEGYVQPVHGKGVFIIYKPLNQATFTMGSIESFKESAARNHLKMTTTVVQFAEIVCDEHISCKSGFPIGETLYYIQRTRSLDGISLILDINLFLKSAVPGITKKIAEKSIYDYIEKSLGVTVLTSKRRMTVEHVTEIDEKYLTLDINDYNCVAVVTSQTYNSDGIMFEYTQSRHRPDYFSFQDTATRRF